LVVIYKNSFKGEGLDEDDEDYDDDEGDDDEDDEDEEDEDEEEEYVVRKRWIKKSANTAPQPADCKQQ